MARSLPPSEIPPEFLPPGWTGPGAPPLEIDMGCHKGLFLVEMARRYPERNFLGVELQIERVERTRKKIRALGLVNAEVVRAEGMLAVRALPEDSAAYVHVLFPDPWPKRRHYNRRLVQTEFLKECFRALKPGGLLRLVTDDESYATFMAEAAASLPAFSIAIDDREYPLTEFQKKFLVDARAVHSVILEKTCPRAESNSSR